MNSLLLWALTEYYPVCNGATRTLWWFGFYANMLFSHFISFTWYKRGEAGKSWTREDPEFIDVLSARPGFMLVFMARASRVFSVIIIFAFIFLGVRERSENGKLHARQDMPIYFFLTPCASTSPGEAYKENIIIRVAGAFHIGIFYSKKCSLFITYTSSESFSFIFYFLLSVCIELILIAKNVCNLFIWKVFFYFCFARLLLFTFGLVS